MARLALEVEASGVKRGTDQAKTDLDRVKTSAVQAEKSLDNLGKRGAADMNTLAAGTRKAAAAQDAMAVASARNATASGNLAGKVQNVSFQIGDFATQVGAGTAASVALAQQLPQLLGGFGAIGAAAGALVAIGVPLAAAFLGVGDASERLTDSLDGLEDATGRAVDAAGELGEAWREAEASLADVTAIVAAQDALLKLQATQEALVESSQRSFVGGFLNDFTLGLLGAEQGLEGLQSRFGLTEEAALDLLLGMQRLDGASPDQMSAEIDAIVRDLIEAKGGVEELDRETVAFILELARAQDGAAIVADILETYAPTLADATTNANGLTGALANAAAQARLVQAALHQAQIAQSRLDSATAGGPDAARAAVQDDAAGIGEAVTREVDKMQREAEAAARKAANAAKKKGGGGQSEAEKAAKELEKLEQSYERLRGQLDPVYRAQTQFDDALEIANDALAKGIISQEEYAETLTMLKERLAEATSGMDGFNAEMKRLEELQSMDTLATGAAKSMQQAFSDFLFNPFEGGVKGMVYQFSQALRQMAADAIAAQAVQAIFGLIGGGSSFGGLPFGGGSAASGIQLYDTGGYIASGQTAIVGERRREVIDRPTAIKGPAQVTGGAQTARMDGGAAPQVNVAPVIALNMQQVVEAVTNHPMFETRVTEVNLVNG